MIKRQEKIAAFTLVELVIYVGLVVVIVLGLVYFLIGISQSRAKAIAISEVQASERQVFSHLQRVVKNSATINWNASSLDTQLGSLVLVDYLGVTNTFKINNTGTLVLEEGGSELALVSKGIVVNKLNFKRLDDKTVGIELDLSYLPQTEAEAINYSGSWQSAMRLAN